MTEATIVEEDGPDEVGFTLLEGNAPLGVFIERFVELFAEAEALGLTEFGSVEADVTHGTYGVLHFTVSRPE